MPRFQIKTRLKSALQKLNFLMVKAMSKSYALDYSAAYALARLRIVRHSNTASFSIKITLCEINSILFSKNYWKLDKVNARFWKKIQNKGKVTLDSFWNFAYVSSYLHLKSFAQKRDCSISSKLQTSQSWPSHPEKLS